MLVAGDNCRIRPFHSRAVSMTMSNLAIDEAARCAAAPPLITGSSARPGHCGAAVLPGSRGGAPCVHVAAHTAQVGLTGGAGFRRRVSALAGFEPALAGCVHQACGNRGLSRVSVVGEIAGGYHLAGDRQPPSFPLLGCAAIARGTESI